MASFMPARARVVLIAAAVGVAAASVAQDRSDEVRSWQAAWQARQAQEAERREVEGIRRDYERRRAIAHARMRSQPDTMHASRPNAAADAMCPVVADPEVRRAFQRELRQRREEAFRRATGLPLRTGLSVHPVPKRATRPVRTGSLAMSTSSHPSPATTVFAAASSSSAAEPGHMVPLFPSASDALGRQGFARVINHGDESGEVTIEAFDDQGTSYEPLTLTIATGETIHFNAADLENGNAGKGLVGSTGPGVGDWRLEFDSGLDIEVLSYIRTGDGFLTAMHDTAPEGDDGHGIAIFNPGSNTNQQSLLRLVNHQDTDASVTITGIDDKGTSPRDGATVAIPPGASATYTAAELESGNAEGLTGSIGDGSGKWRLTVRSEQDIVAMSLLSSPTGHLTNLSTAPDNETGGTHSVPLFPSASDANGRQGFLRVVNHAAEAGEVTIGAFDDTDREYDTLTLAIGANETKHFNSDDLELGNAGKGLTGSTGAGAGDWRLELTSDLDIEVLAYIRTTDGFLTAIHDPAPRSAKRHRVAVFNPGSNANQVSVLRLVNADEEPAEVTVIGVDDRGMSPNEGVTITVPAGRSVSYTAAELESGNANGLDGSLGDGSGKWRLTVNADRPIVAMSLLSSPTGHLTNLSTAPQRGAGPVETAEEAFEALISPIVQSKCVNCHYEGNATGDMPVFVRDRDVDHQATNLKEFEDYLADIEDGANRILNKIQGALDHGGGSQVSAGTPEFAGFEQFLELLGAEIEESVAVDLFEGVTLESPRRTLWRAAIMFAGRVPTEDEYATVENGTDDDLRRAIRGLMECPESEPRWSCGFHEFLIRGANDRLLTDRHLANWVVSANNEYLVEYTNLNYEKHESARETGDYDHFNWWETNAQYGFARAPLELIAHVVENERPYTEILTADYVMANPPAAEGYGDEVEFGDPGDASEFRQAAIESYYRLNETKRSVWDRELGTYVHEHGNLGTHYPHAGILNTTVFLIRYPTTATNRNRARSRWTYYHFLGVDIEKSEARTMDPAVLDDTGNPTMNNNACTVCHERMDPVAGAFQNYDAEGMYKTGYGGVDSLDEFYKEPHGDVFRITAQSYEKRETVSSTVLLTRGSKILVSTAWKGNPTDFADVGVALDEVTVYDGDGVAVDRVRLEELADPECGWFDDNGTEDAEDDHWVMGANWTDCRLRVPVEIPEDETYQIDVAAWHVPAEGDDRPVQVRVAATPYRESDVWYRDMRTPGFVDSAGFVQPLPDERTDDSLRWLAQRIVEDERFAKSVVRFWWPSLMGAEVAEQPGEDGDADYDTRRREADAQTHEIRRLADGFRRGFRWSGQGPHNLKDLLVELSMSKWFRAAGLEDEQPLRRDALKAAGAKRMLTPEELARKTAAVTGVQWRRNLNPLGIRPDQWRTDALSDDYRLLYGGIDSDGITDRLGDITPIMAAVANRQATEVSCPVVLREFYVLPDDKRLLFDGIGVDVVPTVAGGAENPSPDDGSRGAMRIKTKLAELHERLYAVPVAVDSADVSTAYALFVDVWERKREAEDAGFFDDLECAFDGDHRFFEGVADDIVPSGLPVLGERENDAGGFWGWDYGEINEFKRELDPQDPHGAARAWVVVLAYLLMDYRYLYL